MIHELPVWFEGVALTAILLLLLADLAIVARRPHVPSMRPHGGVGGAGARAGA